MPSFEENPNPANDNIRFQLNGKQVTSKTSGLCEDESGQISINFGNLLPMLEEAITSRRMWVKDFADEEIRVSSDLFDVIQAFRYFHAE